MNEYVDNEARKARLVGKTVTMAHGAGGRQTSELINMIFKAHFDNPDLTADDAAVLTPADWKDGSVYRWIYRITGILSGRKYRKAFHLRYGQ